MKRALLVLVVVLSGPLTLTVREAPLRMVRQRPWNLASQPLPTLEQRESLAPGQLVPIDRPSELAHVTSIGVALTNSGQAALTSRTVELHTSIGSSPTGPFTALSTSRVVLGTESLARLTKGGWVDFPLTFEPSALPASQATLRFQLTSPDNAPLRVVERHLGALGFGSGWGRSAKSATWLEGELRTPLPDFSGLTFLIDATSEAGAARLELFDMVPGSAPLRSAQRSLPAGLRACWIDFDFEPLSEPNSPSSYRRDFRYTLELPPGTSVRGTAGRPSLRSYHAGARRVPRKGSALEGVQPLAGRDLVFRITTSARPDWKAAGPAALLGLALGLVALAMAVGIIVRLPHATPEEPPR